MEKHLANLSRLVTEAVQDELQSKVHPNSKDVGDSFYRWCLKEIWEFGDSEVEEASSIGGPYDAGIDAIFEDGDTLWIIQTKYGKSHRKNQMLLWSGHVNAGLSGEVASERQDIIAARNQIQAALSEGRKVRFVYVTSELNSASDRSTAAQIEKDSRKVILDIKGIYNTIHERAIELPPEFRTRSFAVTLETTPLEVGGQTMVAAFPLREIWKLVQEAGSHLYISNIRSSFEVPQSINRCCRPWRTVRGTFGFITTALQLCVKSSSVMVFR